MQEAPALNPLLNRGNKNRVRITNIHIQSAIYSQNIGVLNEVMKNPNRHLSESPSGLIACCRPRHDHTAYRGLVLIRLVD